MPFNIADTHTLLLTVQGLAPVHSFLLDRYFPTNEATDIFATTDVLVEYRDGTRKASPFVVPMHEGVPVLREGYSVERFTPAMIKPVRTLTSDDLQRRGFGEALYTNLSPDQRQGVIIASDLDEMRMMNRRRKEAMAAEVLLTNKCVMNEYADDLGKHEAKFISFYKGDANTAAYTPAKKWDVTEDSGKQIINDIWAMAELLAKRGLPSSDMIVGADVADLLLSNAYIQKLLDNRRYEFGGVNPEELPSGATKIMRINVKGHMIDVLSYTDTYEDTDGSIKSYIPNGKIVVTAPGAGRTVYGAITQVEQVDGKFHTYKAVDVPKYISDPKGNTRTVELSSAPLCIPNNKDPWISAEVM